MNALPVLLLLFLSSLVSSQQTRPASNSVTVFTSLVLTTGFGAGRMPTVGTSTVVITSTLPLPSPTSSVNSTTSSNSTISASASGNATSSTTSNLPTAATTVIGGGISGVAPMPGETGGPYGPPDSYTAGATALVRNTLLVGLGGCIISGALVIL